MWTRNESFNFFPAGCTDEEQRQQDKADERGAERHQGAEAVRVGTRLQRQSVSDPRERTACAEEGCLPRRRVHLHLGLRSLPGEGRRSRSTSSWSTWFNLIVVYSFE